MKRRHLIPVVRWTARLLATAFFLLVVTFAIGEGLPPVWKQPTSVKIEFLGMSLMIAGAVVGWRRDGLAGILILAGYVLFPVVELSLHGRFPPLEGRFSPFDVMFLTGIVFCLCGWFDRKHRTSKTTGQTLDHPVA